MNTIQTNASKARALLNGLAVIDDQTVIDAVDLARTAFNAMDGDTSPDFVYSREFEFTEFVANEFEAASSAGVRFERVACLLAGAAESYEIAFYSSSAE